MQVAPVYCRNLSRSPSTQGKSNVLLLYQRSTKECVATSSSIDQYNNTTDAELKAGNCSTRAITCCDCSSFLAGGIARFSARISFRSCCLSMRRASIELLLSADTHVLERQVVVGVLRHCRRCGERGSSGCCMRLCGSSCACYRHRTWCCGCSRHAYAAQVGVPTFIILTTFGRKCYDNQRAWLQILYHSQTVFAKQCKGNLAWVHVISLYYKTTPYPWATLTFASCLRHCFYILSGYIHICYCVLVFFLLLSTSITQGTQYWFRKVTQNTLL